MAAPSHITDGAFYLEWEAIVAIWAVVGWNCWLIENVGVDIHGYMIG